MVANGVCAAGWDAKQPASFLQVYKPSCTVAVGGRCDMDIDECVSSPCKNGAGCSDSSKKSWNGKKIAYDAFSCACKDGWANGVCTYGFISQYAAQCRVQEGGVCDVDVDECVSSPCKNGAACFSSKTNASIPANSYSCSCTAG